MNRRKLIALAIACGLSATIYAAETFDMGNVQVVGKDAQSGKITQNMNELSFGMANKPIPLPELTPEMGSLEYTPLTEKPIVSNIHRENKNEFSAALGVGNRDSSEIYVNGKVGHEDYDADLIIIRQSQDGFKSNINSERTGFKARVSTINADTSVVTGGVEILGEKKALRGTNASINAGTDANAKLEDDYKRIWVKGDNTLENGAFVKGYATIDALNREISNSVGFKDEQEIKALRIGGTYQNRVDDKTSVNATLDIRKEDLNSDFGKGISFTKTVAAAGVEKELSPQTLGAFGIKAMSLKSKDKLSPYFNVSYKPDDTWKLSLGYEEDLGNDNLEKIFLPNRYVDTFNLKYKASKKKTFKTSLDYRIKEGDTIGIDLFSQKETDAISYYDIDNFNGRNLLSSRINFNNAKRKGITLRGDVKIEEAFTLSVKATAQTPEDSNGNRLSYEPKRILDVGLNYTKNKIMIDFTRRSEESRKAYVGINGGPVTLVNISDYTRSDLALRYKISDRFTGYIKIKDLYDEGKKLRNDVSEEGRVTLGGLEVHF